MRGYKRECCAFLQEWYLDDVALENAVSDIIELVIRLRRGSLFYILNLIVPSLIIFLMSFVGFFLPLESGEKVGFQTSIFLALVVFLLMIGDMMPRTPKYVPILGTARVFFSQLF